MHDHHRIQVVNPEILDLVVAHGADRGACGFLSLFDRHPAGARFAFIVGQRGVGHFNQVADLVLTVFQHLGLAVAEQNGKQDDQRSNGCRRHYDQFAAQGHSVI